MEVRILPGQPILESDLRYTFITRTSAPIVALGLSLWVALGGSSSGDTIAVRLGDRGATGKTRTSR